ncbi:Retrovirus-related Pol polyprotein from transposon 17.6 [Merluccius polli]|uniref:Retrovirus-related Pol polyprotein from transposon 17.6 n=1 Tax=Merluccius polli TaxID=89951 RepID=A0AA47N4Q0_MERPO|nr:Retrovirus-related Pol polyprotein from transposon 17.6 [Merluccius polli]
MMQNLTNAIRPKVEVELQHLEDQGILSKVDWATPIVPVVKKTGALRICADFKVTVNPVLHADQYPLLHIKDIFASPPHGEHFSKIDLAQAYLQMEACIMPQQHGNMPWTKYYEGYPQCYLDDIVTGADDKTQMANLQAVLSSVKVPKPQKVSQRCYLLGLINYHHKFLPNLSTVLHSLNSLLQLAPNWSGQKTPPVWTAKQLITSEEVLTHFDPSLQCVTFPVWLWHLLLLRSLNSAERNYVHVDRGGLSLVWRVNKFNQCLYKKHVTLITNHQPLVCIFNPQKCVPAMAAARLPRWALFLGAQTYTIEFTLRSPEASFML